MLRIVQDVQSYEVCGSVQSPRENTGVPINSKSKIALWLSNDPERHRRRSRAGTAFRNNGAMDIMYIGPHMTKAGSATSESRAEMRLKNPNINV